MDFIPTSRHSPEVQTLKGQLLTSDLEEASRVEKSFWLISLEPGCPLPGATRATESGMISG